VARKIDKRAIEGRKGKPDLGPHRELKGPLFSPTSRGGARQGKRGKGVRAMEKPEKKSEDLSTKEEGIN